MSGYLEELCDGGVTQVDHRRAIHWVRIGRASHLNNIERLILRHTTEVGCQLSAHNIYDATGALVIFLAPVDDKRTAVAAIRVFKENLMQRCIAIVETALRGKIS